MTVETNLDALTALSDENATLRAELASLEAAYAELAADAMHWHDEARRLATLPAVAAIIGLKKDTTVNGRSARGLRR